MSYRLLHFKLFLSSFLFAFSVTIASGHMHSPSCSHGNKVEIKQHINGITIPSLCTTSPDAVEVFQPDGTSLMIIGYGNMADSYTETIDGYTVIRSENAYWEYAIKNDMGFLESSGIIAGNPEMRSEAEIEFLESVPLNLRHSESYRDEMMQKFYDESMIDEQDYEEISVFPSIGEHKVLLLLIEYPDLPATYSVSDFEALMNEPNYGGTGSFRDFYLSNSYGKLDLHVDVAGWYMAENNYEYYGRQNGHVRARELVREAVDAAHADSIDFSIYDNTGDGELDGIMIVHSGPGAEEGSQLQYIWSHRWTLAGSQVIYNDVLINNYAMNPETRGGLGSGKRMVGIGIFCHEFGHVLGLPDLYDTQGPTAGVGRWAVMASGSWLDQERSPANMSPWSRIDMEWIEPYVINDSGLYTLPSVEDSNLFYKVLTPNEDEFFLLENRQKKGFDRALMGDGLAIWYINKEFEAQHRSSNRMNANEGQHAVRLIQADDRNDLENNSNRGDAYDLYPVSTFGGFTNNSFHNTSAPAAVLASGEPAGIRISDIENNDSLISFYYSLNAYANFFATPHTVCKGYPVNFNNSSLYIESYEWDFGDGNSSTSENPVHEFNEAGIYKVTLTATDETGEQLEHMVEVKVVEHALAKFRYTIKDREVKLTNLSENANSFMWRFSQDDMADFRFEPTHTYDKNGWYELSLLVENDGNCQDEYTVEIYVTEIREPDFFPNPFADELEVSIKNDEETEVTLSIYDISGRKLSGPDKLIKAEGRQTLEIPEKILQRINRDGVFIFNLEVDGKEYSKRIIRNQF